MRMIVTRVLVPVWAIAVCAPPDPDSWRSVKRQSPKVGLVLDPIWILPPGPLTPAVPTPEVGKTPRWPGPVTLMTPCEAAVKLSPRLNKIRLKLAPFAAVALTIAVKSELVCWLAPAGQPAKLPLV